MIRTTGRMHQLVLGQNARPAVEQLQHLRPRLHLPVQERDDRIGQQIDQPLEQRLVRPRQRPGHGEILRPAALHDIGGQRPGCAGKADQRGLRRKILPQPAQRPINRSQVIVKAAQAQSIQRLHRPDRLQDRTLSLLEGDLHAQCIRNDQDVREQDGRIHAVTADRLKRDLDGEVRTIA
jgi:hypothetical protein